MYEVGDSLWRVSFLEESGNEVGEKVKGVYGTMPATLYIGTFRSVETLLGSGSSSGIFNHQSLLTNLWFFTQVVTHLHPHNNTAKRFRNNSENISKKG